MTNRHALEAVDRTLRDIMGTSQPHLADVPFGGKAFVLGGDFRQVLPVVRRGDKAAILAAALKNSLLWRHVTPLRLHINMRVQQLSGICAFLILKMFLY